MSPRIPRQQADAGGNGNGGSAAPENSQDETSLNWVSTFGVDPDPKAGIPLGLLTYALRVAQATGERSPEGRLTLLGNDLSRLGVQTALDDGTTDKVVKSLRVALNVDGDVDGVDVDAVNKRVENIIGLTRSRVAVISAARLYFPTLRARVEEVDSLIARCRNHKKLAGFVVNFVDNVLRNPEKPLGRATDNVNVHDTVSNLLPPSLLNDRTLTDEVRYQHAMYGPIQAAVAAGLIDDGCGYTTYEGTTTKTRPGIFKNMTLSEMTQFLACEVPHTLLDNTALSRAVSTRFIVTDRANGWSFTHAKARPAAPFYMEDSQGAGTDEVDDPSGKGMQIPLAGHDLVRTLRSSYWKANIGTGAGEGIDTPGARKVIEQVVEPLLVDFLRNGKPPHRRTVELMVRTACDDTREADNILRWAGDADDKRPPREVLDPKLLRKLVRSIAEGIAMRASEAVNSAR